ncbi:MAG: hypothetical protein ACFFE8_15800 [Candidatus Heimdallarchaeota archaeon]
MTLKKLNRLMIFFLLFGFYIWGIDSNDRRLSESTVPLTNTENPVSESQVEAELESTSFVFQENRNSFILEMTGNQNPLNP